MKNYTLFLLLLFSGSSFSQITITQSDFQNAFAVNEAFSSYATSSGSNISVFVGQPSSSAQYWDLSTYSYYHAGNTISIEPTTAPFYSDFSNSNLVLNGSAFGMDTISSYTYHQLTSDKLTILGLSDETSIFFTYDPPVVQAMIPLQYGTTWQRERDSTYIMPNVYFISEGNVTVDAFGTMKLPSGEFQCLRLTQDDLYISYTPVSIDTLRTRSYHLYAQDMTEVHILGIAEDQINLTTVEVNAFNYAIPGAPVSVEDNSTFPQSFNLKQNYPNPFNPNTRISWQSPVGGWQTLKVYDVLGNEVATLVNEYRNAGTYEIDFEPASSIKNPASGVYFYQLKAGNFIETKKMLMVK